MTPYMLWALTVSSLCLVFIAWMVYYNKTHTHQKPHRP